MMKTVYLVLVALVLASLGALFAFAPNGYVGRLGATISDPNLLNMLHSFGGLYLGFAAYLLASSRKESLKDGAVLCSILVMIGLLVGRIISVIADGMPDPKLWTSLVVELVFAAWGIGLIARKRKTP